MNAHRLLLASAIFLLACPQSRTNNDGGGGPEGTDTGFPSQGTDSGMSPDSGMPSGNDGGGTDSGSADSGSGEMDGSTVGDGGQNNETDGGSGTGEDGGGTTTNDGGGTTTRDGGGTTETDGGGTTTHDGGGTSTIDGGGTTETDGGHSSGSDGGTTAGLSCFQIETCANRCFDTACTQSCEEGASSSGLAAYQGLLTCLDTACPHAGGGVCDTTASTYSANACATCFATAQESGGACATQSNACKATSCTRDADCSGIPSAPHCDVTAGVCVACESTSQCPESTVCIDYVCLPSSGLTCA